MWSNDIKCKYMFMIPLKNLARKELSMLFTHWATISHEYQYLGMGKLLACLHIFSPCTNSPTKVQDMHKWLCSISQMASSVHPGSLNMRYAYVRQFDRWPEFGKIRLKKLRLVWPKSWLILDAHGLYGKGHMYPIQKAYYFWYFLIRICCFFTINPL